MTTRKKRKPRSTIAERIEKLERILAIQRIAIDVLYEYAPPQAMDALSEKLMPYIEGKQDPPKWWRGTSGIG
jgi:hypothetical protein